MANDTHIFRLGPGMTGKTSLLRLTLQQGANLGFDGNTSETLNDLDFTTSTVARAVTESMTFAGQYSYEMSSEFPAGEEYTAVLWLIAGGVLNPATDTPLSFVDFDWDGSEFVTPGIILAHGDGGAPTAQEIAEAVWTSGQRTTTEPNTTSGPSQQYTSFDLIRGDSYGDDSRSLLLPWDGVSEWPTDLSAYTWTIQSRVAASNKNTGNAISGTIEVITPTGDSRALKIAITSDVAGAAAIGLHDYSIKGTLISDSAQKWGPVLGTFNVKDDYLA